MLEHDLQARLGRPPTAYELAEGQAKLSAAATAAEAVEAAVRAGESDTDAQRLLRTVSAKISNLKEHLTEMDVTGAIRDIADDPVIDPSGIPYQHLKEVQEALMGLVNQIEKLKDLQSRKMSPETRDRVEQALAEASKDADQIEKALSYGR